MLGCIPHDAENDPHRAAKVFVVGNAATPVGGAAGLAFVLVDVNQVDVTRHIEFARAQLAHADDPQFHGLSVGPAGGAVAGVEFLAGPQAGLVQGQFSQFRDGAGDVGQRRLGFAVQPDQAFHDQLAQDAQGRGQVVAARAQGLQRLLHALEHRCACRQQGKLGAIAAVQALEEA